MHFKAQMVLTVTLKWLAFWYGLPELCSFNNCFINFQSNGKFLESSEKRVLVNPRTYSFFTFDNNYSIGVNERLLL